jgi:2-iminobutanoate/2-iminopropanoate deaminase
MQKKIIETLAAPKAIGPYSQAIQAGGFVFVSGQIPLDPATGDLVSGSVDEETARVLDNIRAILEAAGLGMGDVVKTTVYLADLGDFARVNEVYSRYFESEPPARATVQVAALPRGARVEIEAIAAAGKG